MNTWTKVPGTEEGVLTDDRGRETHRVKFLKHEPPSNAEFYDCFRHDSRRWIPFDSVRVEDGDREAAKNLAKWICGEDQM